MQLEGADDTRLLRDDGNGDVTWWERWLCGRTRAALHIDALSSVRTNLVFGVLSAASLLWTFCTVWLSHTETLRWPDVWDGIDLLLALPTLVMLHRFSADPPTWLARWCTFMLVIYTANEAADLWVVLTGRWSRVPSRCWTTLMDAGSLGMWMQCVYYNTQLARALARQAPMAYVTVSVGRDQVSARAA